MKMFGWSVIDAETFECKFDGLLHPDDVPGILDQTHAIDLGYVEVPDFCN